MPKLLKNLVVVIHLIILILMYASPFWLDWRLIILLAIINFGQFYLFGGCILAKYQFGSQKIGFQEWLVIKMGIKVKHEPFRRVALYYLPFVIIAVAIVWQVVLDMAVPVTL